MRSDRYNTPAAAVTGLLLSTSEVNMESRHRVGADFFSLLSTLYSSLQAKKTLPKKRQYVPN